MRTGICSSLTAVALLLMLGLVLSPTDASAADFDCADFSSQAEAQENLLPGDPYGLDGDSDGAACEDNPCPCSYESGGEEGGSAGSSPEPPKPPPYRLSKRSARAEAKRLAGRFVRRNPSVDALAFGGCSRLATRRIDCRLTAHGETATQRTTCHLRVAVRARNRHAAGRIAFSSCRTTSTLFLTYERARQALLDAANVTAEKRVGLELSRINRLEFEGFAEWTRSIPRPEICTLGLLVELRLSNELRVEAGEPACKAA